MLKVEYNGKEIRFADNCEMVWNEGLEKWSCDGACERRVIRCYYNDDEDIDNIIDTEDVTDELWDDQVKEILEGAGYKEAYEIEEEKVKYDSLRKTYFNNGDGWVQGRYENLEEARKAFEDACSDYDGDKNIAINLNRIFVEYDEDGDEVDSEYIDCIERFTFDDYRKALKNKMSLESDEELRWDREHFSGLECELADELLTERLGSDWNE